MTKNYILTCLLLLILTTLGYAQTKVSGIVLDDANKPIAFANVSFQSTTIGVITDEKGRFYLETTEKKPTLVVAFMGYTTKEIILEKPVNYNLKVTLDTGEMLQGITLYTGKTSKKNNPAIDILKKIWERKRKNGLRQFKYYQYNKYEKVEFDLNSIDSAYMKKDIFKGMEFIFKNIDTSSITGKTYLPIFINESLHDVYGDNTTYRAKEILTANRNSGYSSSQRVIEFIKDLYAEYDIYDNYLNFFDKSFVSPLSKTGINVYNYVLTDSTFINNKWCYNITYYPRRKNELTFKGDFWVNDTTFAIKKINLQVNKSANINWVKDVYIEQEFDLVNDSTFILTRDYMMTDFAFSKKESAKGMYGKRTTSYRNHVFNQPKEPSFYKEEVKFYDNKIYNRDEEYWEKNRFEKLNDDEKGVYKMLDTLKSVPKFQRMYDAATILVSGYVKFDKFDYGPVLSTFGYNVVEGLRLYAGGRTNFGPNDTYRIQGYTAFGCKDLDFKYGILAKAMVEKTTRLILSIGNRYDIEQVGASLTASNDVLGRSFASSSILAVGAVNDKLSWVNLTSIGAEIEPIKDLTFTTGISYKTVRTASPTFNLDYYTNPENPSVSEIKKGVTQSEFNLRIDYTPGKKNIGFAVDRPVVDRNYLHLSLNYNEGLKGILNSDFAYHKVQLYFRKPTLLGAFGNLTNTIELGKTFGDVPLALMSVVPGNQSYFKIPDSFNLLSFYEFVADTYVSGHLEHNFNGNILARFPLIRKLNLREIVGVKAVYGTVTDSNKRLNASGLDYQAPSNVYWEYHAGIGNILKVLRVDFCWRGNYFDHIPKASNFGVKMSFGFYF